MSQQDTTRRQQINAGLNLYAANIRAMPGINNAQRRNVLVEQMLESVHRVQYIQAISQRPQSVQREDPSSNLFDPLKAAIRRAGAGQFDEACWLPFLSTHFGRTRKGGWSYVREVYGGLGQGQTWDW